MFAALRLGIARTLTILAARMDPPMMTFADLSVWTLNGEVGISTPNGHAVLSREESRRFREQLKEAERESLDYVYHEMRTELEEPTGPVRCMAGAA